jgi:hypothetical protein
MTEKLLAAMVKRMKKRGSDPLRPLLDEYLLERTRTKHRHVTTPMAMEPPKRPAGRISPSQLCGCERAAIFKFVGAEGRRKVNPDQELVFDDGNWRHLKWQAMFRDMEAVLGPDRISVLGVEMPVLFPEMYIAGTLDVLVDIPEDGTEHRWVIDIKGINRRGFDWICHQNEPVAHHVKQLVSYEKSANCGDGFIWYECKDTQRTKAFIVRHDDEAWTEVESWCGSVLSLLSREMLPDVHPECDRGTFRFSKCPYSSLCFGKRSDDEVEEACFSDWNGIDAAWRKGNEE